ncbi:MAG: DUF559 domain-containing protein [Methylorubrum populi]
MLNSAHEDASTLERRRSPRQHGLSLSSSTHPDAATRRQTTADDLARGIARLAPGERLVVIGIGREGIGDLVSAVSDRRRSALLVSCEGPLTASALIDRLLDDLAELALDHWPRWHGRDESVDPLAADPWLKAASKRARLGLKPRVRRMARELELAQLLGAIDPAGVLLVWEIDPASAARARPVIEALEWCMRHGAAVVTALTVEPPEITPYDRILYSACELVREERAAVARFIAPAGAHPASDIERRVAAALERDADLAGLFVGNASVPVGAWGAAPRVDLLCRAHRVVVELDGPEHRAEPKFGNDRHRDYELLTAGYLVLRLTNDQVAADLPLAIEKIRAVVRLRRGMNEG